MQQRQFGPTGVRVPVIGQGSWTIEQTAKAAAVAALRRGLDLGLSHIDTAELYGSGAAEEIVGEAIAGRRDTVFLVSKVMPSNASRTGTIAACEASLKRLGTDRLDCYLLHWRGRFRLEDTIAGFERLKADGKILSWGLSNFDETHLEAARRIAGDGHIACNQVYYQLQERGIEHRVIPWCEAHGVAVVAYSPFGSGDFPEPRSSGGQALAGVARARGATPRQVALAFLTRRPSLFTIPKAVTVPHVEENAGAADLTLTDAEMADIDRAFPLGRHTGLAMI